MEYHLNELPTKPLFPGLKAKPFTAQNCRGFLEVEQRAGVPEHHHPHEQIMHVVAGNSIFSRAYQNLYFWGCGCNSI